MSQTAQEHWEELRAKVDNCLRAHCDEQQKIALTRNEAEARLWELTREVVMAGGKRLRPYLVNLMYQAYGGTEDSKIIQVAASWEFLHQAMLMHDDIIDRDYIRHGQPNVAGRLIEQYKNTLAKEDYEHYANSGALLAGDLALSAAYQLFLNSGFTSEELLAACQLFGQSINTVIGGELLDTEAVMEPIESTDSLLIAELKTASYSFIGPMQCGAILAGANDLELQKLNKIGGALGVAFQLRDDLLGIFGDEKSTGKSTSSDIYEGKHTLLVQYAIESSSQDDAAFLSTVLGNQQATDEQVAHFREILVSSGAQAKIEQLANFYLSQADEEVEDLAVTSRHFLERYELLTSKLRQRKS